MSEVKRCLKRSYKWIMRFEKSQIDNLEMKIQLNLKAQWMSQAS